MTPPTDPDRIIGCIGLNNSRNSPSNRGFWLGLPWHGQGLMTEAADAVTDYDVEGRLQAEIWEITAEEWRLRRARRG